MPAHKLRSAHFTPNPLAALDAAEKVRRRLALRECFSLAPNTVVGTSFGKLIPKKDPQLIQRALARLASKPARPLALLVVGSGEIEAAMREQAAAAKPPPGRRRCSLASSTRANWPTTTWPATSLRYRRAALARPGAWSSTKHCKLAARRSCPQRLGAIATMALGSAYA